MTAPPDDNSADLHAIIAALRAERDAGLAREATLAEELTARTAQLAERKIGFDERIEYQSATNDVLIAMSSEPDDTQPVFDLITLRARKLCNSALVGLFEIDGELLQLRSSSGNDAAALATVSAQFPMPLTRGTASGRAILEKRIVHICDVDADQDLSRAIRDSGSKSILSLPLMRNDAAIGTITLNGMEPGGFSDSQIELLKTFAEQAVIAISSSETYRALQTRTSDLQETLEYQTATSDVLKVISRSAFDLQPVLETVVETAARLCDAEMAMILSREGELLRQMANFGFPAENEVFNRARGPFRPEAPSVILRAVLEARAVHIHDVAAVPGYPAVATTLGRQRTSLGVPLMREGQSIGAILLARQRVQPFTDRQIELVSTFADQAVIAIENTRLITEQREALEQQTATAEVLGVINASPGNLTPVFDAMLEKAVRLSDSAFGLLAIYDGEYVHVGAMRDASGQLAEAWREPRRPKAGGAFFRLVQGEDVVHLADSIEDEAYRVDVPGRVAMVDQAGARSQLLVALRKDGVLLGAFNIFRKEVRPFSDKQIALLQTFAAQAVIAMENARLITEQREALEQQTATAEVLGVINASPGNLAPVFDAMLEKALRLSGSAFGLLRDFDGKQVQTIATRGLPEALAVFSGQTPLTPEPGGALDVALKTGQPAEDLDLRETDVYKSGIPGPRAMVDLGGARTVLQVPLVKDRNSVGLFTFYRQEVRSFSPKEIALLENFAAQAVIAMENARLLTEQQEALERQTAMAEVLAVINANPGELGPVFDMILEKAHRLCDIGMGALLTCEAGQRRAVVTRGYSPEADAHARRLRPIPDNLAALAKSEAVLHDPDVSQADGPLSGDFGRTFVALTGARTYLVVPLSREGTLLGYITAVRREVRPFTERQITLLKNFAAQAVIAMENARLITEQREALEQQTATAEVLQVINASPGNLAPVFDAMLEKAMRLCGAAFGILFTFDGELFHAVAMRGVPAAYAEFRAKKPARMTPGSRHTRMLQTKRPGHFIDLVSDQSYQSGDASDRAIVDLGGARTVLYVPLVKDQIVVGTVAIYRQEVRAFSDKEITLLENFAAQAVIAMENARLITEQREALEQQTATAEVLQVINASPGDLQPVFDAMLQRATRLCGTAIGSFWSYNGEAFQVLASTIGDTGRTAQPPPDTALWRIAQGESVVQIADVETEPAYRADAVGQMRTRLAGTRTALAVALRKDETLVGAITTGRPEVRPFTDKQIALLENFAAQAVIAMDNARLITEQREALEQQTATADVLRAINASPGELAPVFDVIGEKAIKLCDAAAGALMLPDGDRFRAVALGGVPEAYAEFCANSPAYGRPHPGSLPARMLAGDDVVHIKDITNVDEYAPANTPSARALAELGGGRTLLGVALRKDDKFFGMITIFRQEVKPFSDRQIALLRSFADQAVIAMENARLLEEVQQRQEELRITFENMGDGVAMFDETQHLVAWNRKFQDILDVPDDIIARRQTFSEYVDYLAARGEYGPEADPEEHVRRLIGQAGQPRTYERTRPDGRVIEVRHNPVAGGGFVLIYADITERKQNEAEIRAARDAAEEASRTIEAAYRELKTAQANLIQAEKMASLGQLTAGIAHEIKNPLNFVNNFAALSVDLLGELKETAAPGFAALTEKQRAEVEEVSVMLTSNLEKITEHGKRADGIVKAMLEHSRGSSGERRMVDLNGLIDEALNLAYHGARAHDQSFNITLERDFGAGITPIEVNPQDITRVFLNIFSNGFYAATRRARDGGDAGFAPTLKVTTSDDGEAVEIRVRDNGTGIPVDIRDKLFQPFFTTKPTGEGTGLGLSITYDIVTQQHGGSIAVDSKVGDYSEFTVRLPRNP